MAKRELTQSRQELIATYKSLLRLLIEQRPSGLRLKIANALGTHKSFVSQITNPADPTPLPSNHVNTIIEVCQLTPREREMFLSAFGAAHPTRVQKLPVKADGKQRVKKIEVEIPVLNSRSCQKNLESLIRSFTRQVVELLEQK